MKRDVVCAACMLWVAGCALPTEDFGPVTTASTESIVEGTSCERVSMDDTVCSHFYIDYDGFVTSKRSLDCVLEELHRGSEDAVFTIGANGKEGQWAWDWEIHAAGHEAMIIRHGWLLDEDGEVYDVSRAALCRVAPSAFFESCLAEDALCNTPAEWFTECEDIELPCRATDTAD